MTTRDESRLARWSRLKRTGAEAEAEAPARGAAAPKTADPAVAAPASAPAPVDDESRPLTPEEEAVVKELDLPPVESLAKGSDFRPFMDKRVPEFLRRQALRKLWTSDPLFSFVDRMNEYDEDYSIAASLAAGASTYRPDQGGYAWRDAPKQAEKEPADDGKSGAPGPREIAADAPNETGVEDEEGGADEETVADKARRLNGPTADVRAPAYTANPYFQAPGVRESQPAARVDAADDIGEAEDDTA